VQRGDEPDETRRLGAPEGTEPTRRIDGPARPDTTRRLDGPPAPGGPVLGGRYRLDGMLGSGGMADVHRATDLRLNRPVAVKVFRPSTDPDGEQRFHDEAQILANLSHPGLVAVHDFGVEQHRAYLVMELVEGPTLREVLDRERLPVEEVARIGIEVAQVLAYVHAQGVVHRDVKPSNILLGRDGRVRLADFGISRLVDSTGLTAVDAAVGTVSYMAPEHVQGDHVGPPADVYALGLVLLEALTGRPEYPGGSWGAAAERLERPPRVPTGLPARMRDALRAMTETDPAARPTARQVAGMLADATAGAVPVEEPPSRTGRTLAIALGLLALLAVLAVAALTSSGEPSEVVQPDTPVTATEDPEDSAAEPTDENAPDGTPAETAPDDGGDVGGDGEFEVPELPSFEAPDVPDVPDLPNVSDLPDLPDLPDAPEIPDSVQDDVRTLWARFTDWLSNWF
jgi:serine/threonine protein kinase